jgi:hypothetical protein
VPKLSPTFALNSRGDCPREFSIDVNELVRLVKKYELYIKPIKTCVLGDFYDSNE